MRVTPSTGAVARERFDSVRVRHIVDVYELKGQTLTA